VLYSQGAALPGIGFWRIFVAALCFGLAGLRWRSLFRIPRRTALVVALGGGALVALFEVAYQFAIAGVGVAGAAALLYTAPVMVALLSRLILGERLSRLRLLLALVVAAGAALTVSGGDRASLAGNAAPPATLAGVIGGLSAAASYAGTTLLARAVVPAIGPVRFLFFEIAGGSLLLGAVLVLRGGDLMALPGMGAWVYVLALALGTVVGANLLFFAALERIDAAPTSIAATIEPVIGSLLALFLLGQDLDRWGWLGLAMVVTGVAGGYRASGEGRAASTTPPRAPGGGA
jgi:DME family drug/metabolite transporter